LVIFIKIVEKIGTSGIIFQPVKKAIILFLLLIPPAGAGKDKDSLVISREAYLF